MDLQHSPQVSHSRMGSGAARKQPGLCSCLTLCKDCLARTVWAWELADSQGSLPEAGKAWALVRVSYEALFAWEEGGEIKEEGGWLILTSIHFL